MGSGGKLLPRWSQKLHSEVFWGQGVLEGGRQQASLGPDLGRGYIYRMLTTVQENGLGPGPGLGPAQVHPKADSKV